eukprot:scaffold45798_cov111-Phaeocystis_antarctica.AAC.2
MGTPNLLNWPTAPLVADTGAARLPEQQRMHFVRADAFCTLYSQQAGHGVESSGSSSHRAAPASLKLCAAPPTIWYT